MALVNLRFEDPETAFVASQIANIIFNSLWFWSRALLLGCELRILLQMFLNLNPYFYPIYYVWQWTDPIFNFGRAWYPKLVGFDFTPMINFVPFFFQRMTFSSNFSPLIQYFFLLQIFNFNVLSLTF